MLQLSLQVAQGLHVLRLERLDLAGLTLPPHLIQGVKELRKEILVDIGDVASVEAL